MNTLADASGFEVLLLLMLAFCHAGFLPMLAAVTVSNAWRLRNPLIAWKSGKLAGYPLFASLFLGFSAVASLVLYQRG